MHVAGCVIQALLLVCVICLSVVVVLIKALVL